MRCERMKELVITDYSDGEISDALKREVEEHLRTCSACRQFKQEVQKTAIHPFKRVQELKPPASVWNQIKETIALKERKQLDGVFADLKGFIRHGILTRKPVGALATVVTVILIALVLARFPFRSTEVSVTRVNGVNGYVEEQIEFLGSLDSGETDYYEEEFMYLGTSIEDYLL